MHLHSRRSFLQQLSRASLAALSACPLAALAQQKQFNRGLGLDRIQEERKQTLARYQFAFSSPYLSEDATTTPHAHQEIKQLIESYTQNKVYVKIYDGGVNGIGSSLASSVMVGATQGALLSIANVSPLIPALDLINIPYWCAESPAYLRLFQSALWQNHIVERASAANIKVLFPYVVGARTATSTKLFNKRISKPEDFAGVRFRVPASNNLHQFYQLTGAQPVSIMWRLAARTARADRFDALDPSVIGLFSGPDDLRHELGIISEIESVQDGWVAIANLQFIEQLDSVTRKQFLQAFEAIQQQQLLRYRDADYYCRQEFAKLEVPIYQPTISEKNALSQAYGADNPAWQAIIKLLLGSNGLQMFERFRQIASG